MTKLIALIAAGSFAATALFAGEHGEGMLKVQNEKKEMKMACTISLAKLNLAPDQRKKMNAGNGRAHEDGLHRSERGEIHGASQSHHDSGAVREVQSPVQERREG